MNYKKRRKNNTQKNIKYIFNLLYILLLLILFVSIFIFLITKYLFKDTLDLKNININKTKNIERNLNINNKKTLFLTKTFKKEKLRIFKHNSLILRFSEYSDIKSVINQDLDFFKRPNYNNNSSFKSVFIFRNKYDLTSSKIKKITNYISKLDKNILFFIDQEGGKINRYIDFEKKDLDKINNLITKNINKNNSGVILQSNLNIKLKLDLDLNKNDFLITRLNFLNKKEGEILKKLLNNKYFPSLGEIGKSYNLIGNLDLNTYKKSIFLEVIAYIRLKELNRIGVNTYGLVLDLDRGNPIITDLSRSFSDNIKDYKTLIQAFKMANNNFNIKIYFKHFPGHGIGNIDSHKGILDLTGNIEYSKYLKESIELFNYGLKQIELSGLMIGHMIVGNEFTEDFDRLISKSSFIITDDLGMQGFKKIRDIYYKKKKSSFFTTNKILNLNNIIIINTVNSKIE